MLKVCIISDNGQYSVGVEPQNEAQPAPGAAPEAEAPGQDMGPSGQSEYNPAKDIDDALNQARQLLMQDAQQVPQGASPFDQGMESVAPSRG